MNENLKKMIKLWNVKTMDWLGYDNQERYSFHHLIKKIDGGKETIDNGAVLHQSSHSYLHTIEFYDLDKYVFLNKILKEINTQRYMPTKEQLKQIKFILLEFQYEYENKYSSRNKPIIKQEYRLEG